MMLRVCVLFAIVTIGTALGGMTQTALNTLAPLVLEDLNTQIGWGQWLTTIYMLAMGIAVPLASFLVKRFSMRTLLVSSFSLYLVGSVCDFAAIDFPMLIVGRVLEAMATGVLMPLLQTIAMTRFPDNRHGAAMGIAGIALGFAPNIGPTIGGAIAAAAGWRAMFLILVVASAVLLVASIVFVREREVVDQHARLETVSFLLSAVGFCGVLLGFTCAANYPLSDPLVWAPVTVGAVFLALFLFRQRKIDNPLVNLAIFDSHPYRVCMAAQCTLYGCFMGMTLIIPLFIIEACGMTSVEAGLALLPGALAALVFEPGAGIASDKFGPRKVAIFGASFLAVGAVSISLLPIDAPLWMPALCQVVRAIGFTTLIPTTTAWGLEELRERGITTDGSAFNIMTRQVSGALATAIMVFLVTTFSGGAAAAGSPLSMSEALGFHLALGFSGLLGVATLVIAVAFVKDDGRSAGRR